MKSFIICMILVLFMGGCSESEKGEKGHNRTPSNTDKLVNRTEIENMGITYNIDSFEKCAEKGNYKAVKLFLDAGMDVNACSVLYTAIIEGQTEIAKLLIKSGADVNSRYEDSYGTCLIMAVSQQNMEIVKALIASGADVNADGGPQSGNTKALIRASNNRNLEIALEIAEVLIKAGANVNKKDYWGNTALGMAAYRENIKLMKILISAGADIHGEDVKEFLREKDGEIIYNNRLLRNLN